MIHAKNNDKPIKEVKVIKAIHDTLHSSPHIMTVKPGSEDIKTVPSRIIKMSEMSGMSGMSGTSGTFGKDAKAGEIGGSDSDVSIELKRFCPSPISPVSLVATPTTGLMQAPFRLQDLPRIKNSGKDVSPSSTYVEELNPQGESPTDLMQASFGLQDSSRKNSQTNKMAKAPARELLELGKNCRDMKVYCLTCDEYRKRSIMQPQFRRMMRASNSNSTMSPGTKSVAPLFMNGFTGESILDTINSISKAVSSRKKVDGINKETSDTKETVPTGQESRLLRPSEVAISLNSYRIVQDFYLSEYGLCMIMEDDVIFLYTNIIDTFYEYLQSTNLSIEQITGKRPYIIYGCYIEKLSSQLITKSDKSCMFRNSNPRYGNPLYVINRSFAKIILDNFFPINLAYDDFLLSLVRKHQVRCLRATPMLAYELSSHYYQSFHTKKDKEHKDHISRFSTKVIQVSNSIRLSGNTSKYSRYILSNCGWKTSKRNSDEIYLLLCEAIPCDTLKGSVISGAGINNPSDFKYHTDNDKPFILRQQKMLKYAVSQTKETEKEKKEKETEVEKEKDKVTSVNKATAPSRFDLIDDAGNIIKIIKPIGRPTIILSVRGPLTRMILLKMNIFCPEIYGDPLLVISDIYKMKSSMLGHIEPSAISSGINTDISSDIPIVAKDRYKIGFICGLSEYQIIIKNLYLFKDVNSYEFKFIDMNTKIEEIIDKIYECNCILSSLLQGLIISHSYNKKAIWISLKDCNNDTKFRFRDYYKGIFHILGISSTDRLDPLILSRLAVSKHRSKASILDFLNSHSCWNPDEKQLQKLKSVIINNNPILDYPLT